MKNLELVNINYYNVPVVYLRYVWYIVNLLILAIIQINHYGLYLYFSHNNKILQRWFVFFQIIGCTRKFLY